MARKLTEAYENCKPATRKLFEMGARRMETLQDRAGVVVERYVVGRKSVLGIFNA